VPSLIGTAELPEPEVTTVKAARSISRWGAGVLLPVALSAACAGSKPAPEPAATIATEVAAQAPLEPTACSEVRAMVCDSVLRPPAEAESDEPICGVEASELTQDLLLCLDRAGASCDEVAERAIAALLGCGQRLLVDEAARGDAGRRRARTFMETWVESRRPWLAVGPLGFVVAPEMARRLAASSLRRGDGAGAVAWLGGTEGVDSEDFGSLACRWAASAPELRSPPRDLADLPAVVAATLAWQGCEQR
jgi:hypothetical protein